MLHCTNIRQSRLNFGHYGHSCRFSWQFLAALLGASFLIGFASAARAQTAPGAPPRDLSIPPATTLVDPQAEKQADRIKEQTWRSAPVGLQKNWNLDIGHFREDKSLEQDLRDRISDEQDAYSGFRLRLQLGSGP